MKITMVDIDKIVEAKFNPALRTSEKVMRDLLAAITASQEIDPLHIGKDGILGDGHRRLACAKILGWEKVPTIKSKTRTSVEIYLGNDPRVSKSTKSAEWLQAVYQGFPIDMVPPAAGNYIKALYAIMQDDEIAEMARVGQSPGIMQIVRTVARHIGATEPDQKREICLWIYKHGIQQPTRQALKAGCPVDAVIQAIKEDRPIEIVYR